jgi:hypothetical protein
MTSIASTKKRVRILDCLVLCSSALEKLPNGLNSDMSKQPRIFLRITKNLKVLQKNEGSYLHGMTCKHTAEIKHTYVLIL